MSDSEGRHTGDSLGYGNSHCAQTGCWARAAGRKARLKRPQKQCMMLKIWLMAQRRGVKQADRSTGLIEKTRSPSIRHGMNASTDRTTGSAQDAHTLCILLASAVHDLTPRLVIVKSILIQRSLTGANGDVPTNRCLLPRLVKSDQCQ